MTINLGSKHEFLIDGVWTDYTSRIRGESGISITNRGSQDQSNSGFLSAAQCDFTINNRDGLFSNRNPTSALYQKFPVNTQVRHSVPSPAPDNFVRMFWPDRAGTVQTTDKASLDITGDIDVRVEVTPDTWRPTGGYVLAGKGAVGTLAWTFYLSYTGALLFVWTTDGTTSFAHTSGTLIPATTGRLAVRVTLDVNLGGTQKQSTFYTAPSLAGPWTSIGTTTNAGITSIFANSAPLEVGATNNGGGIFSGQTQMFGKIHGFELYSGIAGTKVADFDPTAQALGATSWSDGLASPNTWTLAGTNRVTSDQVRFVGAMRRLPTRWDGTGRDVFLPVSAAGPLDGLTRNKAIRSAIYRNFIQYSGSYAYWPMEAASGATTPDFTGTVNYSSNINDISFTGGTPTGLDGSAGSMTLDSQASFAYMGISRPPASNGTANFAFYFRLNALPTVASRLVTLGSNGTGVGWTIEVDGTGFIFTAYDSAGSVVATQNTFFGSGASPLNQWIGMQLILTTETTNVRWQNLWHAVGTSTFYTTTAGGSTYAGTTGRFHSVRFSATGDPNLAGAQIAHAMIGNDSWTLNTAAFADASKAYSGELAGRRIERLASEEGLSVDFIGHPDDTAAMGPQTVANVVTLFQNAATVDGGILGEARDAYRLAYSTRAWLGLAAEYDLSYTASILSATPEVSDDDRYVINDASVSRPNGSTRRSVVTTGPNSTAAPPDGVGTYESPNTVSAEDDDQLQQIADRTTFQGTWDEPRIPQLTMEMRRSEITATVSAGVLALDTGMPVTLTNMPSFIPLVNSDLDLLVIGYTEIIGHVLWTLTFNTIPRGPYLYARLNSPEDVFRVDADASTLNADITSSATSLVIKTPQSPFPIKWVDSVTWSAEFPLDIVMGGEKMTMTACTVGAASGSDWLQTATVTRSVNDVVKAHVAADVLQIRIAQPTYIGA